MDALLRRRAMIAAGGSPTPPPTPTPTFYTYLYFDGTAYVTTDYTLPENCSIGVRLGNETSKAAQRVFRATGNGSEVIQMIYSSTTTSTKRYFGIYYDSSSINSSDKYLNFSTTTFNFFLTPKRFGWGTTASYTYTKGSTHPTGAFQVGGWGTGQPFTGRMETIRIYGSDAQNATTAAELAEFTPVATFRPWLPALFPSR